MRGLFEGWHVVLLLILVIVLFGAKRLPDVAKSVGQSLKIFKGEMQDLTKDDAPRTDATPNTPPAAQNVDRDAAAGRRAARRSSPPPTGPSRPRAPPRRRPDPHVSDRRGGEPGGRMPLRAHLVELRHRVFLAVLGILVGAVIGWFLYTPVFAGPAAADPGGRRVARTPWSRSTSPASPRRSTCRSRCRSSSAC